MLVQLVVQRGFQHRPSPREVLGDQPQEGKRQAAMRHSRRGPRGPDEQVLSRIGGTRGGPPPGIHTYIVVVRPTHEIDFDFAA